MIFEIRDRVPNYQVTLPTLRLLQGHLGRGAIGVLLFFTLLLVCAEIPMDRHKTHHLVLDTDVVADRV